MAQPATDKRERNGRPMEMFSAAVSPGSINESDHTVEVVFYTGASVPRYNYRDGEYMLTLSLDASAVLLDRLNSGAPVLRNHDSWDFESQTGVVEKAWLGPQGATAKLRFAVDDDEAKKDWSRIQAGIYRNISMGVWVLDRKEVTKDGEKMRHYLATKWEPFEISIVPVPADFGASFMAAGDGSQAEVGGSAPTTTPEKEAVAMENELTATPKKPGQNPAPDNDAIRAAATAEERTRIATINKIGMQHKLAGEFVNQAVEAGTTVEEFRVRVLDHLAARDSAQPQQQVGRTETQMVADVADKRREGMSDALLSRHNSAAFKATDAGRQFRGMSLLDMAKECLDAASVEYRGRSKFDVAKLAMQSTSDFPYVLENIVGKTLRRAYEASPKTFMPIVRIGRLPDFREVSRVQLGNAPALLQVAESGEYESGNIGEGREKYAVKKYGRIVAITFEAIVNDDLDAFNRIPATFGASAANLESDLVWGIITGNPTLADSIQLFHADHKNIGTQGAINETTIGELLGLMRVQKTLEGVPMNLIGKTLAVPAAKEGIARKYLATNYTQITKAADYNPYAGAFDLVVEPRLDGASTTAYYMFADPASVDTIELGYLDGEEGPQVSRQEGFNVDGIQLKCRHIVGAKAIDFRGMAKNAGS